MTKYIWHGGKWFEYEKQPPAPRAFPFIQTDLPEYVSPLSMKAVSGRRERREEMARYGVREVDPSERPHGAGERKSDTQAAAERKSLAERPRTVLSDADIQRLTS